MPHSFRDKAKDLLQHNHLRIKNHPSNLIKKLFSKPKKITVITAAYNAEQFISKTIESVINQTMGFDQIQYIIIDDCSTDSTGKLIEEYAAKYKDICYVSLNENTGSPGTPRNIGIELAEGDYITFLDADDWLAPNALEWLMNILDETNDDYVVGKTIKVESKGESIIGEFNSISERRSVSPFDIPYFFYHMGPTARMMKLSLLKENNIGFPDMKFAEDKLFFCDVFLAAKSVSTTTEPIYFVNRMDDNQGSLTRTTNVLDKRRSDLKVIHYIKAKNLPVEQEKIILNRLYEYDIVRTFDSMLFVNSTKKEEFISILEQAMETTTDLKYDFKEEFETPLYKTAVELILENRTEDFISLFHWFKKDKNKRYVIKNDLPYLEVPFLDGKYRYVRIPILARALNSYIQDHTYYQEVEVYGDDLNQINHVLVRDRTRYNNEHELEFERDGNLLTFKIELSSLNDLQESLFTIFLRYNNYKLVNIKRITKNQISYGGRSLEFYTTVANNLGLAIKSSD
ncbi:glycosyltransferase family 2 protein [Mesobacillus foraminis]|uniref:glycosyltransferase family 2 protein n=1 Tax=Mesobacillus foraminis TaxID=279826 RepID=UPI000EF5189D|nr:glycosyltransferase family 2 protein [Mesobacillus foraminis]